MEHNPNRYSLHVNYLSFFLNTNFLLFFLNTNFLLFLLNMNFLLFLLNTNYTNYTNKLLENERFERFVFKNQLRMKDS